VREDLLAVVGLSIKSFWSSNLTVDDCSL